MNVYRMFSQSLRYVLLQHFLGRNELHGPLSVQVPTVPDEERPERRRPLPFLVGISARPTLSAGHVRVTRRHAFVTENGVTRHAANRKSFLHASFTSYLPSFHTYSLQNMSRSPESSDDEAPEAFSFSTSKKSAQNEAKALEQFRAEEKLKLKEKRRQRDKTLKERKEQSKATTKALAKGKGKGKAKAAEVAEDDEEESEEENVGRRAGGSASREELEDRMERAMREAQDESGESDESDEEDFGAEGVESSEEESEDEFGRDEEDVEMLSGSEDEDEDDLPPPKQKRTVQKESKSEPKKDYLPDHLFASAFSQLPAQDAPKSSSKSKKRAASPPPTKRKRVKKSTKETVVGYVYCRRSLPL